MVKEDVEQELVILFLHLVDRFDLSKSMSFAGYIKSWLVPSAPALALKLKNTIYIPKHYYSKSSPYFNHPKVIASKKVLSLNVPSFDDAENNEDLVDNVMDDREPEPALLDRTYLILVVRTAIDKLNIAYKDVICRYLSGEHIPSKTKQYYQLQCSKEALKKDPLIINCAQIFGIIKPQHIGISYV